MHHEVHAQQLCGELAGMQWKKNKKNQEDQEP